MDWKRFDRARRTVGPEGLDLIESYAEGRINRRDFVRRGTVIGLSVPFLGAVIAACGGDDDDATSDTEGGSTTEGGTGTTPAKRTCRRHPRRHHPGRRAEAGGPLDPIDMQDLGTYGIIAQCFEFLTTLGDSEMSPGIAPGLAESWEPNADGSVWTFNLRQGVKWHDGTDFTSADVAATMDRLVYCQATPAFKASSTPARSTQPIRPWPCSRCSRRTATSRISSRSTTPSRSSRRSRSRTARRSTARRTAPAPSS